MADILIQGGKVLTMRTPEEILDGADVAVSGNQVVAVGAAEEIPDDFSPDKVIDAEGKAVLPGFVNAHNHAAMTLFRGYADDMRLMEWLETRIWPAESRLTSADVYWGTLLAAAEMVRSGITAFADMYFEMEEVARAVLLSGMRGALSVGLIGVSPNAADSLERGKAFFRDWHGTGGGRVEVMLGPHAPYTCQPAFLASVIEAAGELGAAIHIHLAETRDEVEGSVREYGVPPIIRMEREGLFTRPVLAAHCVHLTPEEIEVLAANGVRVAHNPISNQKLASGIAPVPALMAAGIVVGLGTDGAASTNHLNMFEEMRAASWIQKVSTGDPTVMPAATVLHLATRGGALALGWDDLGSLEAGNRADLIIVDLDRPHLCPQHDLHSLLAYSAQAGDVETVIIDGVVVMEERRLLLIDEERVQVEAAARAKRLVEAGR